MMVALLVGGEVSAGEWKWKRLASLPDQEGFAGAFAGVAADALIVAGGANFPGEKPWNGGTKVWYDGVFVLERPDGAWSKAGNLPRPLGYGVCVTHRGGVVCVGGGDADRNYADAFRLDWTKGRLLTTTLPPLPEPRANAAGALVGDVLYVVGGQEAPDSRATSKTAWTIDLAAATPRWREIAPCPGGRMLAVAASFDGAFWLAGGVDLIIGEGEKIERRYSKNAYRHHPRDGWRRIADLPDPLAAGPTPAPTDATGFLILGGDDGTQVGTAPDAHRGFSKRILHYDPTSDRWTDSGALAAPRVTVPCVIWNKAWVVPSGEARPGIRSPEVWAATPEPKE